MNLDSNGIIIYNPSNSFAIDTSKLKNIENFRYGALEHIFDGVRYEGTDIVVGYHYRSEKEQNSSEILGKIVGDITELENGVYQAKLEIDGIVKTKKVLSSQKDLVSKIQLI